jgi:hypothetical protein
MDNPMVTRRVFGDDAGRPVYRLTGPLGVVTYRMAGNQLRLEPQHAPAYTAEQGLADLAFAYAAFAADNWPLWTFLNRWYETFPAEAEQLPATVGEWRELRGPDLVDAMRRATWYAHFNDEVGGWSVMPIDQPTSSGAPEVGCFLAEQIARDIADDHNNKLTTSGDNQ